MLEQRSHRVIAFFTSLVMLVALAAPSSAATNGEDFSSLISNLGVDEDVVLGGTTQDTNPTGYDYVPSVLATSAMTASGVVTPMDASGTGATGAFSYTWGGLTFRVPSGRIAHTVKGKGLQVTKQTANWIFLVPTAFQICNYQWQFQNRLGTAIYSTVKSPLFNECRYGNLPNYSVGSTRNLKAGQLCARLYVQGTFRGEQCHTIKK